MENQPVITEEVQPTQANLYLDKARGITSSITNTFQQDRCDGTPNCDLCSLLNSLTPELFTSDIPVMLTPAFDVDHPSYLNSDIFEAISIFERKMKNGTISNIDEIPSVIYVNIVSGKVEIISHSHIMFIMPNPNGSGKNVYTMGLGINKESNTVVIRSPDFNPYTKITNSEIMRESFSCTPYNYKRKQYEGMYIVKAIEPLTVQYYTNFNNFLSGKINGVRNFTVGKNDIRKKSKRETIWSIQTTIPYSMFNAVRGENCASFAEKMSYKYNLGYVSVSNKFCGINNPSSTKTSYATIDELNELITNIINKNDSEVVGYLTELYDLFDKGQDNSRLTILGGKTNKYKRRKTKKNKWQKTKKNKRKTCKQN